MDPKGHKRATGERVRLALVGPLSSRITTGENPAGSLRPLSAFSHVPSRSVGRVRPARFRIMVFWRSATRYRPKGCETRPTPPPGPRVAAEPCSNAPGLNPGPDPELSGAGDGQLLPVARQRGMVNLQRWRCWTMSFDVHATMKPGFSELNFSHRNPVFLFQ